MRIASPRTLLSTFCATLALAAGAAAHADDDHWKHRGKDRGHKHGHGHWKHHHDSHTVIRERVIVREEPVYIAAPRYYERSYSPYRRDPAIVIGVDIPPLVIPLR